MCGNSFGVLTGPTLWILFAWHPLSYVRYPLAYSRIALVLRVVATAQRTDHRARYRRQLRLCMDPAAAERA